jgi:uncharacterized OB-fold protein
MAVGTAEFPEGLQIPAQIVGCDHAKIAVGMEVEVIADTLYVDDRGVERLTWKFRPTSNHDPK